VNAQAGAAPRPDTGDAYPDDLRDMVERFVAGLRFGDGSRTAGLEEAMRYSLLAGGKRIRPARWAATRPRCCRRRPRSSSCTRIR
jgi:geranylgeranyl diphosphate synthase, type II